MPTWLGILSLAGYAPSAKAAFSVNIKRGPDKGPFFHLAKNTPAGGGPRLGLGIADGFKCLGDFIQNSRIIDRRGHLELFAVRNLDHGRT